MKHRVIASYGIGVAAAIISFILALNIRQIVLVVYRTAVISQGRIPWADAAINSIIMILLMAGWIVYIFYTQNFFEKKCENMQQFVRALLRLLLPVVLAYFASEAFFMFLRS